MFLSTTFHSGIEFVGLLIVFALILAASYYTTKWVGNHSLVNRAAKNITVIESYRIAPNECLQIVKVGTKYLVIGVTKEHIEMLSEIAEEDLVLKDEGQKQQFQFQDVLALVKRGQTDETSKKDKK